MVQANILKYSQDLLQRISGPMTRTKTMRLKKALQSLIMEMRDKELALEYIVFEVSKTLGHLQPILLN